MRPLLCYHQGIKNPGEKKNDVLTIVHHWLYPTLYKHCIMVEIYFSASKQQWNLCSDYDDWSLDHFFSIFKPQNKEWMNIILDIQNHSELNLSSHEWDLFTAILSRWYTNFSSRERLIITPVRLDLYQSLQQSGLYEIKKGTFITNPGSPLSSYISHLFISYQDFMILPHPLPEQFQIIVTGIQSPQQYEKLALHPYSYSIDTVVVQI